MAVLEIAVQDRIASMTGTPSAIASGMQNVDAVRFTTDVEWTDFTDKKLVVKSIFGAGEYSLTAAEEGEEANLPAWALEHAGLIYIGLKAVDTVNKKVLTSTLVPFRVLEGGSLSEMVNLADQKTIHDLLEELKKGGGTGGGPSVSDIRQYYLRSSSGTGITVTTTGWQETVPTLSTSYYWMWGYFKLILSDGTEVNSKPVVIGNYNERLNTVSVYFKATNTTTVPSTTATGWTTTSTEPTASNRYVWCHFRFTYYAYGPSSSHVIYSNVFRLKTYTEPSSGTASGMVLQSNGCGGFQHDGIMIQGAEVLDSIKMGVMPVLYFDGFYAPVIMVESVISAGKDAIRLWYYCGGCSSPALTSMDIEM